MSGHGHSLARDICADLGGPIVEQPLDREHGGDIYAWAKKARIDPTEIIDFSASINPLGPPECARQAFQRSCTEVLRYPDPYAEQLKEALAKHHDMKPAEILIGNGSTQLIYLLCFALRPRKALVVGPAFSEHANALILAGAKVSFLSLTADLDFKFSTEDFMAAWEKAPQLAFLTTPNSVTGQFIPRTEIEKIARFALLKRRFLVIDEAFIDFVERESVKQLVRNNPYLIVLRSLTKYYALPGLRLGYLLAHSQRAAQLAAYLEPWSVNGPAQTVARACLAADRNFALKTDRWLRQERDFLTRGLIALKQFQPYPSSTNFLLVRIVNRASAAGLRSFLLHRKILVRACDSFTALGSHFRVAVRQRKDNRLLLEALREWTVAFLP
jgi:threonine-phosphate decarboxylase